MKLPDNWLLVPKLQTTLSLLNGILALIFLWLLAYEANATITTLYKWIS
jgi:hypothetical protein